MTQSAWLEQKPGRFFFLNLEHHYDPNSCYVAPPYRRNVRSILCISKHFKVEVSLMEWPMTETFDRSAFSHNQLKAVGMKILTQLDVMKTLYRHSKTEVQLTQNVFRCFATTLMSGGIHNDETKQSKIPTIKQ